ncbi:MAG: hypothetical protein Q9227_005071 [Pyrenula ochraceoflavens]
MSGPHTSLEVISASYGTSIVTEKAHSLLVNEKFFLVPSNFDFGDPQPGTAKTFTLTWRLVTRRPPSGSLSSSSETATNPVTTVGFEGHPFHLPYIDPTASVPHQPIFAISREFTLINATFCTVNVTSQVAEIIFWSRSQEVEIPATTEALCPNRDPAPELKKSLTVTYARKSSEDTGFAHHCQTVWQGDTLVLHIGPQGNGSPSGSPGAGSGGSGAKVPVKKFMVY